MSILRRAKITTIGAAALALGAVTAATGVLSPAPASAAPVKPAAAHMLVGANGLVPAGTTAQAAPISGSVSGPSLDQNGTVQPFATKLPFNYTVDFKVDLRGATDFNTSNGKICSDNIVHYIGGLNGRSRLFYVQVWKDINNQPDTAVSTKVSYVADSTQQGYCWGGGFNTSSNYYLRFTKTNDTLEMKGTGDAHQ